MSRFIQLLDPNNIRPVFDPLSVGRDAWRAVREDSEFLHIARRTLFPLPTDREPALGLDPFPPFENATVGGLRHQRIAVVISGGSGATSAAVGVQRAFEEAEIEPVADRQLVHVLPALHPLSQNAPVHTERGTPRSACATRPRPRA